MRRRLSVIQSWKKVVTTIREAKHRVDLIIGAFGQQKVLGRLEDLVPVPLGLPFSPIPYPLAQVRKNFG